MTRNEYQLVAAAKRIVVASNRVLRWAGTGRPKSEDKAEAALMQAAKNLDDLVEELKHKG